MIGEIGGKFVRFEEIEAVDAVVDAVAGVNDLGAHGKSVKHCGIYTAVAKVALLVVVALEVALGVDRLGKLLDLVDTLISAINTDVIVMLVRALAVDVLVL